MSQQAKSPGKPGERPRAAGWRELEFYEMAAGKIFEVAKNETKIGK